MFFSLVVLFASASAALLAIEVQLQEPTYTEGVLKTTKGGIITAEGIRIQAREIRYTRKEEGETKVIEAFAEGDLLIEYQGQFLVGKKFLYDFVHHTGTLWEGRSADGIWFVGGERIDLQENGNLFLQNAFVTTCEGQDNLWEFHAKTVEISPGRQVNASHATLNFFAIPVFWIPSFKTGPGFISDSPLNYQVTWDRGLGPRATIRYRILSYNDFNLYTRLDYRLSKGLGGAIESDYLSKDKNTIFTTKSYGAHDKVVYDESTQHRYRLQGLFSHTSLDDKTQAHLTYDKFSDLKMISDFSDDDFEVATQKRTRFLLHHYRENGFGTLIVEPRLNTFESINQKLPLAKAGIKTFAIGSSGILSENNFYAGFLDYVYAHDLLHSHPGLREVHAGRLETRNRLYRPFTVAHLHATPYIGIAALFYSNNQQAVSIGQGTLLYGGDLFTSFHKDYRTTRHTVEPYLRYEGLSKPKASLSEHYVFSIDDGLYTLNSMRAGIRNIWPGMFLDLYSYAFFFNHTFDKTFPKVYGQACWTKPSYKVEGQVCWNIEENLLDFCNTMTEITINEDIAFAVEVRHRSRFDWRKADHENFLVDMARPIDELRKTSLSDGRNTWLQRIQVRLSPKWSCHISSHYGWGRGSEPAYCGFKIDALGLIACKWQCKFSFTHTTNDDRFTVQMQLNK